MKIVNYRYEIDDLRIDLPVFFYFAKTFMSRHFITHSVITHVT